MNADYNKLKPGLYVQVGSNVKAVDSFVGSFMELVQAGTERNPSVETLAEQVAWVFTALTHRREKILEIPYAWRQGGNDLEDKTPYNINFMRLIMQIDTSLQLYSYAALLKQRGASRRVVGWRWLDPSAIEPDYDTATPDKGVLRYQYTGKNGMPSWIPAKDIIWIDIPGLRELSPWVPAGYATKLAASILRGIDKTADVFYENNGLPVMLVKVPQGTSTEEVGRLENAFRRLFNNGNGTDKLRTKGVRNDVEVEPLSYAPKDLDQSPLTEMQIKAILAAHKVPQSEVFADAANYATDISSTRRFVETMGTRLELIANVINSDDDFKQAGYGLEVRTQDHYSMKEDESQRATSFQTYKDGGFTPEAAAYLVGIMEKDFPEDMEVFREIMAPPTFAQNSQPPQSDDSEDDTSPAPPQNNEERNAEKAAYRRWLKKRDNPDPDEFEAYYLDEQEKVDIFWQVKGYTSENSTDEMIHQFGEVMRRLETTMRSDNGNGSDTGNEITGGLPQDVEAEHTPVLE